LTRKPGSHNLTHVLTVEGDEPDALDVATRLDQVFAALANRRRRRILVTLALHPASIAQLATEQGQSLPAIHRHIASLEEARLIERRKAGRVNYLALSREGVRLAQDWLGTFHAYWGSDAETLDNYIAGIARNTPEEPE
jgi:DNA-binding transcriptional ArsR family regulator